MKKVLQVRAIHRRRESKQSVLQNMQQLLSPWNKAARIQLAKRQVR